MSSTMFSGRNGGKVETMARTATMKRRDMLKASRGFKGRTLLLGPGDIRIDRTNPRNRGRRIGARTTPSVIHTDDILRIFGL